MTNRNARILIADDQHDVLESLRLLLKGEGYTAETFDTPESLVRALRSRTADAVLMDLNYTRDTTSGDEGLDAVTRIRSFDAHTPIVLMTAWGTINLAVEGMRRGAQDFIEKAIESDRTFLAKFDPAADKDAFEAEWQARSSGARSPPPLRGATCTSRSGWSRRRSSTTW